MNKTGREKKCLVYGFKIHTWRTLDEWEYTSVWPNHDILPIQEGGMCPLIKEETLTFRFGASGTFSSLGLVE